MEDLVTEESEGIRVRSQLENKGCSCKTLPSGFPTDMQAQFGSDDSVARIHHGGNGV